MLLFFVFQTSTSLVRHFMLLRHFIIKGGPGFHLVVVKVSLNTKNQQIRTSQGLGGWVVVSIPRRDQIMGCGVRPAPRRGQALRFTSAWVGTGLCSQISSLWNIPPFLSPLQHSKLYIYSQKRFLSSFCSQERYSHPKMVHIPTLAIRQYVLDFL